MRRDGSKAERLVEGLWGGGSAIFRRVDDEAIREAAATALRVEAPV
jgi:hypothetical protein